MLVDSKSAFHADYYKEIIMPIVHGHLRIKTFNGRYGKFTIGYLKSDLGEFTVREKELDQYDEGKYEGDFDISYIEQFNSKFFGKVEIGMRAYIQSMTITNAADLTAEDKAQITPQEADPVIEEVKQEAVVLPPLPIEPLQIDSNVIKSVQPEVVAKKPVIAKTAAKVELTDIETIDPDLELFGRSLWPLDDEVKLDMTVERIKLRAQRDRLNALGYEFEPIGQIWKKVN